VGEEVGVLLEQHGDLAADVGIEAGPVGECVEGSRDLRFRAAVAVPSERVRGIPVPE